MSWRREENEPIGFDLSGKTVVVIGGTSGMGLGAARAAADVGANVIIGGHLQDKLEAAAKLLPESAQARSIDVLDEGAIAAFFEPIETVDHLMVTAAPGGTGKFLEQSIEDAKNYMQGKFWTSYACARAAADRMPEDGSFVFLSGGMATRPPEGSSAVSAAQSATESLARALAVELTPRRANVIVPGAINSTFMDFLSDEEREEALQQASEEAPVGRPGTPADVGQAALFLMTNGFVNGVVLPIDGGRHLT